MWERGAHVITAAVRHRALASRLLGSGSVLRSHAHDERPTDARGTSVAKLGALDASRDHDRSPAITKRKNRQAMDRIETLRSYK
jgi:hypothetical protein